VVRLHGHLNGPAFPCLDFLSIGTVVESFTVVGLLATGVLGAHQTGWIRVSKLTGLVQAAMEQH
jgi:hypothetical protein